MKRVIFGFLLCLTLVQIRVWGQQPQGAVPITYDQPVTGEITAENFRHLYALTAREGDIVTFRMSVTEGDLDPYLVLLDQNGSLLAYSDDEGDLTGALIESWRLPSNGQYFIIATRFGHEQGITTGTYQVSVERLGTAIDAGATLGYGDEVNNEISTEQPYVVYFFEAQRGQVINLHMRRSSGDLDPLLILANYPERQILVEQDDDSSGGNNALITNYVIPRSGVYVVLATRYGREAGTTTGRFVLSLTDTPQEQRGLAINEAIFLEYTSVVTAEITNAVPQRYYVFEGKRGDVVTINMERTGGSLNTLLLLLDSNQQRLAVGDTPNTGRTANIPAYSLPADGDYYIMTTRDDFAAGETEGTYTLSLYGKPGIGAPNMLELFINVPVESTISDQRPFERYVFQGEAGDRLTITMEAIEGNLDPLLTLFFDGKQIVYDDDGGGNKNAQIKSFRLPEDGIYQLEAARFDRIFGTTSGTYRLILEER